MFENYPLESPKNQKIAKNSKNQEQQENIEILHFPELAKNMEKLDAEILAVFPQTKNPESQKLREEFQGLRYKIFSEVEGFEPANDAKLEIDSFDNYSAYIVIKRDNKIIAGCRLILAQGEQQPMPVSAEWPELEFQPNSAEISRFCLDTEIPSNERVVMIHFHHDGVMELAKNLNIDHLYANIRKKFLLLLKKFIKDIGDKTVVLNSDGRQYKGVGILVPVEFEFKKGQSSSIRKEKEAA